MIVIVICWTIFILYWILSARSLKPTKEVKANIGNMWWDFAGRAFLGLLLFLALGNFFPSINGPLFGRPLFLQAVSILLVIIGLIIAIVARKTLATNWSSNVDVKEKHELMTTGIYGYVRHPIYTGVTCMVLGTFLFTGRLSPLIIFIICVLFLQYKMKLEEELMTKHFPKEYPAYKRKTKALIPYIY